VAVAMAVEQAVVKEVVKAAVKAVVILVADMTVGLMVGEEVEAVKLAKVTVEVVMVMVMVAVLEGSMAVATVVALMVAADAVVVMLARTAVVAAREDAHASLHSHRSQSHIRTVPPPHATQKANPQHRPGKHHCMLGCMYLSTTTLVVEGLVVGTQEVAREDTYSADHSQCSPHQDGIALERCRGR